MIWSWIAARRWSGAFALLWSLAVLPGVAWSQEFRHQMHPLLASQMRFLEVRAAMGRVQVTTNDPTRNFSTQSRQGEHQERLAIEFGSTSLSLDYTLSTPQGQYSIRVVDSQEVIVRQDPLPGQKKLPLLFVQPKEGPSQLIIGSGENNREVQGVSLWHLYLAEPEICRRDLFPLLELLRKDWRLAMHGSEIEHKLATWNAPTVAIDRKTVQHLVAELGSDEFVAREQAARQLGSLGPAVAPWLARYSPETLDAEQRVRIRSLFESLGAAEVEDSPKGAAVWMASDPQVWLLLLGRDEVKLRRVALERLEKLLGQKLDFDAEGDASRRARQVEAVSALLREHH